MTGHTCSMVDTDMTPIATPNLENHHTQLSNHQSPVISIGNHHTPKQVRETPI